MRYDFDQIINRRGTFSTKWDIGDVLIQYGMADCFDENTIPLSLADMDFPSAQPLVEALRKRADQGIYGYSYCNNSSEYIGAIQGWFERRHDWAINEEAIVPCPGTLTALRALIRAFTDKGDGVIIQTPVYNPFFLCIEDNHRTVVENKLINTEGYYSIDFDDLEQQARDKNNKMFILCSPHNPVGRVWTPDELTRMAEICANNNVLLIADEIHGDLIRASQTHYPICSLVDDPRIITCTGITKSFNTAGLHGCNLIINDPELRQGFSAQIAGQSINPFTITAVIAAYSEGEDWLAQVNRYIDGNLDFLGEFLQNHMPQVRFLKPEGTYFGWLDFSGYGLSAEEVHRRIYTDANVLLEDGKIFGKGNELFQRITVPSPRSLLEEALSRISKQF